MFALPYHFTDGDEGDFTNCLLSRYPIVESVRIPLGGSPSGIVMTALRTTLDCAGTLLRVDLVHPSPHITEQERVEAFRPLLSETVEPRIVLGDFNALSDEDPYTHAALVADMRPHLKAGKDPSAIATTMLDRKLLATLREHGLRDALPKESRSHTIPTRLARPSTGGARLRIDYVLVSKEIEVVSGRIIQSELADRVSDHYPLVVDVQISTT